MGGKFSTRLLNVTNMLKKQHHVKEKFKKYTMKKVIQRKGERVYSVSIKRSEEDVEMKNKI